MSELSKQLINRIQAQRKKTHPKLPLKSALDAEIILKRGSNSSEDDIFLLLCAANYLNAFVKQTQDAHFKSNYNFKHDLVKALSHSSKEYVHLTKEDHVLIASCKEFQFSFHHVNFRALEKDQELEHAKWNGIRLQPYALELFKEASEVMDKDHLRVNQLKALADPMRLQILQTLTHGIRCACTFDTLPISQSTLSHHLSVLQKANLIDIKKEGIRSNVSINEDSFSELADFMRNFLHK